LPPSCAAALPARSRMQARMAEAMFIELPQAPKRQATRQKAM
jgi:hypothetical protein